MQSKSQPVLNMGPESDYTSEKKGSCKRSASIKFLAFVTTVLLGLVVVIVVMHILGSNCLYPIRVRQPS